MTTDQATQAAREEPEAAIKAEISQRYPDRKWDWDDRMMAAGFDEGARWAAKRAPLAPAVVEAVERLTVLRAGMPDRPDYAFNFGGGLILRRSDLTLALAALAHPQEPDDGWRKGVEAELRRRAEHWRKEEVVSDRASYQQGFSRGAKTQAQLAANIVRDGPPPPAQDGGWRTMESAPRDGTLILVWRATSYSDDTFTVVRWNDDWWQVHDGKTDHPLRGPDPEMWMLPPPPAQEGGE